MQGEGPLQSHRACSAAGTPVLLLTLHLLLLTAPGGAQREERFRLEEKWRDADGEGALPRWLRWLWGWGRVTGDIRGVQETPGPGERKQSSHTPVLLTPTK